MVAAPENSGLEKNRVFKKNSAQWVFWVFMDFWGFFMDFWGFFGFFWGFFGFFWIFWGFRFFGVFFGFYLHISPEERVFRVFSVSRILLGASRH